VKATRGERANAAKRSLGPSRGNRTSASAVRSTLFCDRPHAKTSQSLGETAAALHFTAAFTLFTQPQHAPSGFRVAALSHSTLTGQKRCMPQLTRR
jgi:hypothetical protein